MLVPAQVVDQVCQGVVGRVPRKADHSAGHSVKALFHIPEHMFHPHAQLRVANASPVAIQPVRAEGLGSQCGSARERFAGRQACGQKTRNNGWNVLRDHPRTPTGVRVPSRSPFPTEPGRPNGLPMPVHQLPNGLLFSATG